MNTVMNEFVGCPMSTVVALPVITFMMVFGTPLVFATLAANAVD